MNLFRLLFVFWITSFACLGYANDVNEIRFRHVGLKEGLSHI